MSVRLLKYKITIRSFLFSNDHLRSEGFQKYPCTVLPYELNLQVFIVTVHFTNLFLLLQYTLQTCFNCCSTLYKPVFIVTVHFTNLFLFLQYTLQTCFGMCYIEYGTNLLFELAEQINSIWDISTLDSSSEFHTLETYAYVGLFAFKAAHCPKHSLNFRQ